MYTSRTGLILGFHGTDESIVNDVLIRENILARTLKLLRAKMLYVQGQAFR